MSMPAAVVAAMAIRQTMRKLTWMPGRFAAGSDTRRCQPSWLPAFEWKPEPKYPIV
jgi:hypothetical protein